MTCLFTYADTLLSYWTLYRTLNKMMLLDISKQNSSDLMYSTIWSGIQGLHPFSKPLVLYCRGDAGAFPSISGRRQGNTWDGWPVHHRRTHTHTHSVQGLVVRYSWAKHISVQCTSDSTSIFNQMQSRTVFPSEMHKAQSI